MSDNQQNFTLSKLHQAYHADLSAAISSTQEVSTTKADIIAKTYIQDAFERAISGPNHLLRKLGIILAVAAPVAGFASMTNIQTQLHDQIDRLMLEREPFSVMNSIHFTMTHFHLNPFAVAATLGGLAVAFILQANKALKSLREENIENISLDQKSYRYVGNGIEKMVTDLRAGNAALRL
jgi:hypothetical protein